MANSKQAIKRIRQNEAVSAQNVTQKSAMRTAMKKAETAIANNDENANALLKDAIQKLDKAANKGLIHKNTAARQKSRLTKKAQ
ncbi:30S ribosomal protein S20 [Bhargavaea beijingensis]|uniref:Small ribosomal subunit protein bS20 n=1 Tax=Bhargavaea beijingensis TaxID=426756 RepID=A0A1G7CPA9_9BACL|nr:30S ribosomal protein S20 [Bhargavaea beijingensis]MCW1927065.1 30S ribosomal protein S20 [Bhargavaea beijingensis]RSK30795.1 30S ribosomal protein S20 [Bhargavaea beijingensis]SDE41172.1 small subunit ribosomal protein S20 [Bhargavaea beijingensis]